MAQAKKRRPSGFAAAAVPPEGPAAGQTDELESGMGNGAAKEKPLRPSQCAKYLRTEVAGAFRQIVAGFLSAATSGSCQQLKLATEIVESKPKGKGSRAKGPAQRLMEDLEREFGPIE